MKGRVQQSREASLTPSWWSRGDWFLNLTLFVLMLLTLPDAAAASSPERNAASKIAELINEYRRERGLPPVPFSKSLTMVAEAHAQDMATAGGASSSGSFGTDARGLPCNAHSWTRRGRWTPVCYTADHRYAAAMWSKPREITNGIYPWPGFEIGYWITGAVRPEVALASWARSPAHNAVILEQGVWKNARWRSMGVGVSGGFAFVWFGKEPDPQR